MCLQHSHPYHSIFIHTLLLALLRRLHILLTHHTDINISHIIYYSTDTTRHAQTNHQKEKKKKGNKAERKYESGKTQMKNKHISQHVKRTQKQMKNTKKKQMNHTIYLANYKHNKTEQINK